jgi:hypothetical protein
MTYTSQNYSRSSLDFARDGDVFDDCNISQAKARTKVAGGVKGLTFRGCNGKNCLFPDDATVIDCLYDPREDTDEWTNPLQQDIDDSEPEPMSADEQFQRGVDSLIEQCYADQPEAAQAMKDSMTEAVTTAISMKPAPIKGGVVKVG